MSAYRKAAIDAKGEECHFCGATEEIVVHHIDGDRENNDIENLLPVCKSCHGKIHGGGYGFEEWTEKLPETSLTASLDSVKQEQKGVYMYLPHDQAEQLETVIEEAQFFYKREFGVSLEKNRHLYPAIVERGLGDVRDVSDEPEELRSLLEAAGVPAP